MKLTPDMVTNEFGLTVNEKIIPDSAVWTKNYDSFKIGNKYKAARLMSRGTGTIKGITIHNTGGDADAETYTRATYPNQNMGSARVHYFVDDKEVWQNLADNEVGWHSGMGDYSEGNESYIAIEIIMRGKAILDDDKSEDNGARLTALLLHRHSLLLSSVVTHQHWKPSKSCPLYILPHWDLFLKKVEGYLLEIEEEQKQMPDNTPDSYAAEAVSKAVQGSILQGDENGDFKLHTYITRQDLFVILDRLNLL